MSITENLKHIIVSKGKLSICEAPISVHFEFIEEVESCVFLTFILSKDFSSFNFQLAEVSSYVIFPLDFCPLFDW